MGWVVGRGEGGERGMGRERGGGEGGWGRAGGVGWSPPLCEILNTPLLTSSVGGLGVGSAPAGVEAGTGSYRRDLGQCTMSRSMIVKSHPITEQ